MNYALKFRFWKNDWTFSVFEILLKVSEGNTWQEAFLKVLPERKNARPIVPVQSKEDELQDSKSVDMNNAIPIDISNTVPINVNNIVSIDINNTVTIIKDKVCDKESDNRPECNADLKEILNENSNIT